jgi:hypothetical protein
MRLLSCKRRELVGSNANYVVKVSDELNYFSPSLFASLVLLLYHQKYVRPDQLLSFTNSDHLSLSFRCPDGQKFHRRLPLPDKF